jgi:hypothetical protein
MASDVVELRCHWRIAKQEVHELGARKTKHGAKIFAHGTNPYTPSAPKIRVNGFTVSPIDTVNALSPVLTVSI